LRGDQFDAVNALSYEAYKKAPHERKARCFQNSIFLMAFDHIGCVELLLSGYSFLDALQKVHHLQVPVRFKARIKRWVYKLIP
jgi:hypothetical protein